MPATARIVDVDAIVATLGIERFLLGRQPLIINGKIVCQRCEQTLPQARVDAGCKITCVTCHGILEKLDPHSVKPPAAPGRRIYASSPHGSSFGDSPRSSRGRRLRAEGTALPY